MKRNIGIFLALFIGALFVGELMRGGVYYMGYNMGPRSASGHSAGNVSLNLAQIGKVQLLDDDLAPEIRAQFQQEQVNRFCSKYGLDDQKFYLNGTQKSLEYHLLVNSHARVLYCFAPKVGCTSLKLAFFKSEGKVNESAIIRLPGEKKEDRRMFQHSVLASRIQRMYSAPEEKMKLLREYYKFVMYRHPIERLASAYRDKILGNQTEFRKYREAIFAYVNPGRKYVQSRDKLKFKDYISVWLMGKLRNDHFQPIFRLCEPCRVRYDYYGQFKTFNKHAAVLLDRIGGKEEFLLDDYYSNKSSKTQAITRELYDQVPDEDKRKLLKKLSQDIDFYYHIYPDEKDSHKEILNLPDELTVPYINN